MVSISHWFFKRRGLATGIVTSGSSAGGVIWPIAIDHLIAKVAHYLPSSAPRLLIFIQVGFGWALRICGFISLAITLGAAIMVRGRLPPRTGSEFFAFYLFRSPAYTTFW